MDNLTKPVNNKHTDNLYVRFFSVFMCLLKLQSTKPKLILCIKSSLNSLINLHLPP